MNGPLGLIHTVRRTTSIFKIQKLDCVVVNGTVHMVRFALRVMHTMSHMNGFHTYSV